MRSCQTKVCPQALLRILHPLNFCVRNGFAMCLGRRRYSRLCLSLHVGWHSRLLYQDLGFAVRPRPPHFITTYHSRPAHEYIRALSSLNRLSLGLSGIFYSLLQLSVTLVSGLLPFLFPSKFSAFLESYNSFDIFVHGRSSYNHASSPLVVFASSTNCLTCFSACSRLILLLCLYFSTSVFESYSASSIYGVSFILYTSHYNQLQTASQHHV
ncbi:hypothetical protein DFH11DRAFT_1659651 [Phellopilus nigrolimitatus]|nr:hypothetical protein DFH11DRAFT_1659651 [Phellopilus nigrolimitatus]